MGASMVAHTFYDLHLYKKAKAQKSKRCVAVGKHTNYVEHIEGNTKIMQRINNKKFGIRETMNISMCVDSNTNTKQISIKNSQVYPSVSKLSSMTKDLLSLHKWSLFKYKCK